MIDNSVFRMANFSMLSYFRIKDLSRSPDVLYFGIGGGYKRLSQGLPVDVLSMILVGDQLKKLNGIKKCYILLADEITKTNPFDLAKLEKLFSSYKTILQKVIKGFGLEDWEIVLQSSLIDHPVYQKNLKEVQEQVTDYHLALEVADIKSILVDCILNPELAGGHGLKVGWFLEGKATRDERSFDKLFEQVYPDKKVSFVYTVGGVRLFPVKGCGVERMVPYICYYPERRILFSKDEKVIDKLTAAARFYEEHCTGSNFCKVLKYYEDLIEICNKYVNLDLNRTVGENLQYIINLVMNYGRISRV